MMRFQYILAICILIAVSACQNDAPVGKAKEATKKAASLAVNEVKNEMKEAAETTQAASKDPKVREFYVEEDKSKAEPKKATSKPSSAKMADSTSDKSDAKPKSKSKPKPVSKKSPKLSFTNNSHAFGIIKPGEVIEHKFEFTNTGSADLVITDAKATCGCTQPSFPFVPIPPGEKGFIGVKYDSTGKLGTQKPTVTLTTNAYPKTQKVYLEGLVISELAKKN